MKEDLDKLSKYETCFTTAIKSDYVRALWKSDFDILIPIYEKWTGSKVTTNLNCSTCKLKFIKRIGQLYFKNKEEYGRKDTKETEQPKQKSRSFNRQLPQNSSGKSNNR